MKVYTLTVIDKNQNTHHIKVLDGPHLGASIVSMVEWLRASPMIKTLTYSHTQGEEIMVEGGEC